MASDVKFFEGTKERYDGFEPKNPNHFYYITDTKELYKGEVRIGGGLLDKDEVFNAIIDSFYGGAPGSNKGDTANPGYSPESLVTFQSLQAYDAFQNLKVTQINPVGIRGYNGKSDFDSTHMYVDIGLSPTPMTVGMQIVAYNSSGKTLGYWFLELNPRNDWHYIYLFIYFGKSVSYNGPEDRLMELSNGVTPQDLLSIAYLQIEVTDLDYMYLPQPFVLPLLNGYANEMHWKMLP